MFGSLRKYVYFVTCNNLAKVNISYKIRILPTLLHGSEVSKDGMTVSADFRLFKWQCQQTSGGSNERVSRLQPVQMTVSADFRLFKWQCQQTSGCSSDSVSRLQAVQMRVSADFRLFKWQCQQTSGCLNDSVSRLQAVQMKTADALNYGANWIKRKVKIYREN